MTGKSSKSKSKKEVKDAKEPAPVVVERNVSGRHWKPVRSRSVNSRKAPMTGLPLEMRKEQQLKNKRLKELLTELKGFRDKQKQQRSKRLKARKKQREKNDIQMAQPLNPNKFRKMTGRQRKQIKALRINGLDLSDSLKARLALGQRQR